MPAPARDTIIHHRDPLDVRQFGGDVYVCLAGVTAASVLSVKPATPSNIAQAVGFVDRHHANERTIRSLQSL